MFAGHFAQLFLFCKYSCKYYSTRTDFSVLVFCSNYRSYEIVFHTLFECGHFLFNTGLHKPAFYTDSFEKLVFWLSALFALCQIRSNFINFITFVYRYSVFFLSLIFKWRFAKNKKAFNKKSMLLRIFWAFKGTSTDI